jgi:uncharacterized lipoprotein NlpE involved in copper resistance
MKKLVFALAAVALLSLTACHFRQDEAKETLERNEKYKGDKAEYSVNRAGEGGKPAKTEEVAAPATETKADSTAAAPAEHGHH